MKPLNGKVAMVTGASRGIGRACALALAEAGADIAVNYLIQEDGERLGEEKASLNRGGSRKSRFATGNDRITELRYKAIIESGADPATGRFFEDSLPGNYLWPIRKWHRNLVFRDERK